VAWARVEIGLGVIVRSLILILDEETDRCSKGDTLFSARLQLYKVLLVPLDRDVKEQNKVRGEWDIPGW
jgi:hypothetical protein